MSDSIADAYVSIRPDLSGFREELRAGLDSGSDLSKTVRVDADTGRAQIELAELQARIDELGSKSEVVKIGTSGTARTEIRDIQDALASFRNETLTTGLDPSRLEAINGELDGLDGRLRTVGSDLDSTSTKADRAAQAIGNGRGGDSGGGLLGAALAAAPALGTVGAVGAAGLAGIVTASAAAVFGLGAFGLAAKDNLSAAKGQADSLYVAWQNTQNAFTQPVITNAIGLIPSALAFLNPSVATTSQALQALEGNARAALGSPYWRQFSTYIAGEGGTAIRSAGDLFGGLGHLLSGFAEGFAPELARIDADTQRWAQDLTKWGNEAANGGMSGFINYIQTNGPLVAHTFETLAGDFVTLARASAPLGPIWLNIANTAATLIGDLEKLNPTLTTWAVGLGSAAYFANRLLTPIGGLMAVVRGAPAVWSLAGDAFTVGAGGLLAVATATGGASAGIASTLAQASLLVPGLDLVSAAVLNATGFFSNFGDSVALVAADWGKNFVNSLPEGADKVALVGAAIDRMQGQLDGLTAAMKQYDFISSGASNPPWDKSLASLSDYKNTVGALARSLLNEGYPATMSLGDATDRLTPKVATLKGQLQQLNDIFPGLKSATDAQKASQDQANRAMGAAAGYTGNTALQFGQLTSQLKTANQQLSQTETLLNTLLGMELSVAQSTDAFYSSIQNLTGSLKANGTSMDETTAKGLANKQAFDQVASSVVGVIQSMEKQGDTTDQINAKVQTLTNYLIAQAGKYGLTTAQVEAYLTQLGLTPAQVKTDLQLSGYQQASQQVNTLRSGLDALNGKQVTSVVSIQEQIVQLVKSGQLSGGGAKTAHFGASAGFASGTQHAPGGPAWVGEGGPEVAISPKGQVSYFPTKQVANIPAGTRILTASETSRLRGFAGGADSGTLGLGGDRTVTVVDQRTVIVGDLASKQQVMELLDADRLELLGSLEQLVGAAG